MTYTITSVNPSKDSRWDNFVQKHPMGSVYHHSAWINLVCSTFSYLPRCYALIENETDSFHGVLPLMASSGLLHSGRLVSLPYATYCDPLVPPEMLMEILEWAILDDPGSPRIELKFGTDFAEIPPALEKESLFVNHTVDLSRGMDFVYRKLHKSCVARKIIKAQKSGLIFRFTTCENDLKKIYDLLVCLRKSKGLPPQPYKFFLNMWNLLGPLNMFFAPYVTYQKKIVSAAIVLKFKNKIYYEYGASDPAYQNFGANQFLLWEIMKFGHDSGAQTFSLGRSHNENQSLIEFKERWGAQKEVLAYCYYPKRSCRKPRSGGIAAFGKKLNKRLPISILRLEGEFIYRFLR